MYDADADMVYGAVIAHDFDPKYGWAGWQGQDSIEVYIRGTDALADPCDPQGTWSMGQQFMIGLNADETTTFKLWPNGDDFTAHDPGLTAVAARIANGQYDHELIYEFALVPYDNYGNWDASTTVQTDLYSGKKISYDVVLGNLSPFTATYSMRCANVQTGKAYDVNQYAVVTCE